MERLSLGRKRHERAFGWPDDEVRYDPQGDRLLLTETAPRVILIWAVLAYAVFFGWWSLRKFNAYQAPGFDLGIYDQGLWLMSHLKAPYITLLGLNLFGDHASYILLALVPVYWVWSAPEALLVLQTLALAAGAIPLFLLARIVLRDAWLALLPSVAYLVTPALGWLNLENFHPDSFEISLLFSAFYLLARSRWRWFLVVVFLLLTVKEDVFLVVLPVGIYVALAHHRKVGLATSALAIGWFLVVFFILQPLFSDTTAGNLDAWRIPFGGPRGLLSTTARAPWEVIAYMTTPEKLKYVIQLFAPVLFLPLLTARWLIALPVLLFNLISTFWYQTNVRYHYTSLLIPVLAATAVIALGRLHGERMRRALAVCLLGAAIFSAYLWGPFPYSREAADLHDPQHPQVIASEEAVALIPADAVVAARDKFASHLTQREFIYKFPSPFSAESWGDESLKGQRLPMAEDVEYVLELPVHQSEQAMAVWAALPAEGFVKIYEKEGVVLLKRESSPAGR